MICFITLGVGGGGGGGDKVAWSITPYLPSQTPEEDVKVTICNYQADSPLYFTCGLMSDVVICKHRLEYVIHDTKCTYNNTYIASY